MPRVKGSRSGWTPRCTSIRTTAKPPKRCVSCEPSKNTTPHHSTQPNAHDSRTLFRVMTTFFAISSPQGLLHHFNAVLEYGPTIVYNVPGRTGQDIPPEIMFQLADHRNFAGVKECEGNARIEVRLHLRKHPCLVSSHLACCVV